MNRRRDTNDLHRGGALDRYGKVSTLLMAALAGVVLLVVLLGVVVAVLGPIMATAIVAFVGGLSGLVLLHYVTWGWWLGGMIRRDVEADEKWDAENATTVDGKVSKSTPSESGE